MPSYMYYNQSLNIPPIYLESNNLREIIIEQPKEEEEEEVKEVKEEEVNFIDKEWDIV